MIEVKNVTKTYNVGKKNSQVALSDVSLIINDGELLSIVGKSGAGKSTLLHIIGGMDSFEEGSVCIDGDELKDMNEYQLAKIRNTRIGMVMQDFALIEDYTVEENIELPLFFGKIKNKDRKRMVNAAMEVTGIFDLRTKAVKYLSGGQKQRVAIARAIVYDPQYIIADEPTGALDTHTGHDIMELFKNLNSKGKTVIIVTHDEQIASECTRKIEIKDGKII